MERFTQHLDILWKYLDTQLILKIQWKEIRAPTIIFDWRNPVMQQIYMDQIRENTLFLLGY